MTGSTPPEPSPEPYHEDPDAPYFEHLFGVLKGENPNLTREEALEMIRKIDPTDQLQISRPRPLD